MIKKLSVTIVTLGCSKNSVDSEFLLGSLNKKYFNLQHSADVCKSDILLINTCGFIFDAKQESINTILQAVKLKNDGLINVLIVFGCLTERYKNEISKEIPEIDYLFGVNEFIEIKRIINNYVSLSEEYLGQRILTTPKHYAYLKVSEGCNRKCSFCAIPNIRGKYISKPIEAILNEAKQLAQNGTKEIILIAQDLSYYGIDIYKKPSLAILINKLSEISGIEWIRLHYLYPKYITNELIKTISSNNKVCKYIDIPIQHISNNILSKMRRQNTNEYIINLLNKIKSNISDIAIRTTILVGHPNESENDFKLLLQFVNDFNFSRLGVFTYSHEEDTYAFNNYNNNIPEKVKKQRASILMKTQQEISLSNNKKLINSVQKVIIDRKENNNYYGRTQFDSPEIDNEVIINSNNLKIGTFYNVTITDADEFDLYATVNN